MCAATCGRAMINSFGGDIASVIERPANPKRSYSQKRHGTKGEAALGVLGKLIRGDEEAALMALKIRWVSLPRLLGRSTKMVFENKKEIEKFEEQ